jgi:hypothetical protein
VKEKFPKSETLIYLDYTIGLNKIYTPDEIEKAQASPSFEREYNLKYHLGRIGNTFLPTDIDKSGYYIHLIAAMIQISRFM